MNHQGVFEQHCFALLEPLANSKAVIMPTVCFVWSQPQWKITLLL